MIHNMGILIKVLNKVHSESFQWKDWFQIEGLMWVTDTDLFFFLQKVKEVDITPSLVTNIDHWQYKTTPWNSPQISDRTAA